MAVRRGVVLVIVLILAAVAVSVVGLLTLSLMVGRAPQIASNSTLVLELGGNLQEVEPAGVLSQLFDTPPTVRSITESLRKAQRDNRVSSVIVRPTMSGVLWAKVQEIRDAILEFRESSDKPIIAFLEYGGDQAYYVASACDKVFLLPTASLDLTGIASYELFLRGTLDKIGAYPDALHIGDYKTASNTFTERTFTPAHREMAESLNTDLYEQLVRGIADARQKSEDEVRELIDHGPYLAADAVSAGLIDDLAYADELDDKVDLGPERIRVLRDQDYRQVSLASLGVRTRSRIAVIYAVGIITSGQSINDATLGQTVGSDTLTRYIRRAADDNSVRAIVLRVDSPGGSAIASDVIWREIMLAREKKPVVASMSDVAASGGYYIAMPAHAIVAQPSTLTGSIGVVMMKYVLEGTFDKMGVNVETVSEGRFAELFSPVRPFSPEERARVAQLMQATYDTFVEKAAAGRNTTPEKIDAVGQGRVWTGRQAKQIGLVDELGGLDRALALAKQRADIPQDEEVELVVYPPKRSIYEVLAEPLGRDRERAAAVAAALGFGEHEQVVRTLTAPLRLFRRGEPLALMPNVFVR